LTGMFVADATNSIFYLFLKNKRLLYTGPDCEIKSARSIAYC